MHDKIYRYRYSVDPGLFIQNVDTSMYVYLAEAYKNSLGIPT